MKKLFSMWTSNVEIEACLDSRIFRIKELGFYSGVNLTFQNLTFFRVNLFS